MPQKGDAYEFEVSNQIYIVERENVNFYVSELSLSVSVFVKFINLINEWKILDFFEKLCLKSGHKNFFSINI